MYEIVIGRTDNDKKKLGLEGTIFLGKNYVKMGAVRSLSNRVLIDVAKTHVMLIVGKRGSGKSFTLGVVAEEMANLPEEIKNKLAVLMIDTMGIFWTMKYKNVKEADLLEKWNLMPQELNVKVYVPSGEYQAHVDKGLPVDSKFSINPQELNAEDWCQVFNTELFSSIGITIERALEILEDTDYDIQSIIDQIEKDTKIEEKTRLATQNRFKASQGWGLFSKASTPIKDIVRGGQTTVLDVSNYKEWQIKNLVIGLVAKKLFQERMEHRKGEEIKDIEKGHSYFSTTSEDTGEEMPLVWMALDEAHEALPKEGKTPATDALVTILREGRQPGISLIMATQQPGEIHKDAITQSDIVVAHRLTARKDIDALNSIMQTYLSSDIVTYLNNLPHLKGSAIVLDDNSERIYPIQIRPRFTWHGGEAPTAIKPKSSALKELGI
jgi:uncharacterized protein